MTDNLKRFNPQWILDVIYNGIVAIDKEGKLVFFNQTAEKLFRIAAEKALGRYILDVLPKTGGKLLESLRTGTPYYGEKLQGETVPLIANITPVQSKGRIAGAVSVFQELSEIEKISKELDLFKNMKDWLDTVIDSSYDGLWICDHEGKVVRINKTAEKLHDVKAEEVVGRNMKDLVAEGLIDKSATLATLETKTSVTMIQYIKGKKKLLVSSSPIVNKNGEITFVVCNDRDIQELDHLRSQLQETQALARVYSSRLAELEMKGVDFSSLIFRSPDMGRVVETAVRVAGVDSTVLLLGESGVGKGMIAKLIHKHSERSKGPFISVDCASIPDSLIESELFGYEKGAFTGAKVEGKPGLFELAHCGTLFLDEIGEIPLSSQSKLLHFLEEHEITRVGGLDPRRINVRIIAASNKDIAEMVSEKHFRKDLYYRLNVIPIHIIPLRERKEDIAALIFHFLEKFNSMHHCRKTFSPLVVDAICNYEFPGNVRELANLIERLVVLSEKDHIEIGDLPETMQKEGVPVMPDFTLSWENLPLKEALERCERVILERTLQKFGSQRKASKILRIAQASISRKIKRYSIQMIQ